MPPQRSFGAEICANRQRNHEFSPIQKAAMCAKKDGGASYRAIAKEFTTSPSAVHRIFERWKSHQTLDNKPRSGRPDKLSKAEVRYIILLIKKEQKLIYNALVSVMSGQVHKLTIKRII